MLWLIAASSMLDADHVTVSAEVDVKFEFWRVIGGGGIEKSSVAMNAAMLLFSSVDDDEVLGT